MDDLLDLQTIFLEAAREASDRILTIYATDFETEQKSDQSPVTEADLAAESAILEQMTAQGVGIPVISEEAVAAGLIPDIDDAYILVDPLDGTREFISRNGEFTVNIALVVAGEPVIGVVLAPALGEAFWGAKGKGAFQSPIRTSARDMLAGSTALAVRRNGHVKWRAVASRSHRSPETDSFLEANPVGEIVSFGSSLKLCRVASGDADIYPRISPTNQWDIAAGDAVLRAAGGTTITLDRAPLAYRAPRPLRASGFLNPSFVACGAISPADIVL
ncbi:MAG: 3'(2'),5'-bisphosphate nucleotidase CysQ [Pseudomonadota bacterium]